MGANSLTFDIYGSDKSASKTLVNLGKTAEETGKKVSGLSKLGGGLKSMGAAAGSALGSISASSVVSGIVDTTKDFTALVLSVKGLQRVAGGSIEDASHLSAQFRLSGVSAESGAKSVKKLDVALDTAGKSAAATAAMSKTLGFNFKDAHGKILPMSQLMPKLADTFHNMKDGPEKVALAVKLFGKAGTDMIPMLNKGSKGLADMSDQSDKLGLTINGSMVDSVAKAKGGARTYDAAMMGLKVTIGSQVQPILAALAMFVTSRLVPAFVSITSWMKKHMDIVKILAVALGVLLAGMKLMSIISSISKAFGVLNMIMSANPIGLIIVAIGALVLGFIYLWNHCKPFREFFIKLWADIKGAVQTAIQAVVAAFTNTITAITNTWTKIGEFFSGLWGNITGWVSGLWSSLGSMGSSIVNTIVQGISGAWQGIASFFSGLWSNITGWVSGVWAGVSNFGSSLVNTIVQGIAGAWHGIGSFFSGLWGNITRWVSGMWARIAGMGATIVKTIVKGISGAWQGIGTYFRNLWGNISGWVSGLWSGLGSLGKTIVQKIWSGIQGEWHWLSNFFTGLWGNITGWVSGVWAGVSNLGRSIVNTIVSGIGSAWQGIGTYFRNLWSNIAGWVSGVWGYVSNVGSSIVRTIIQGISGAWQGIGTYFRNLWGNISGWVSGLWSGLGSLGKTIVQKIWSGIQGEWHWLSNFFTGLWGNITGWLGDTLSNAFQWGADLASSILRGIGNVGSQIANQLNPFGSGSAGTIVHVGAKAKGGMLGDGWTQVGEQGPEMVYTSGGKSTVYSNPRTSGGLKLGMSSPGGAFTGSGGSSGSRPGGAVIVNVTLGSGVLFGTPDQLARKLTDTITSAQQRGLVKRSPF